MSATISDVILTPFVNGYLACALWSSIDGDDQPLDSSFDVADITPEAKAMAQRDCALFPFAYEAPHKV